ncbi:DEAD/DEAH box helicase [Pseudoclavibacter chungangensis]|uniref:DEAD/DEAH box helicase n=1 Tax=Pseudoclavibacter chungangensis TaxID=587635 RepID=A0A7J5C030_9MICO|nr:DEAD/DEAH box helicase [Pseudoclavibacter chungangensis]KAB1660261.1 DEAD/DEAH box helicase [Pseudoclavibacter chungangensis]NYJ65605.1 superfamily II DNA/RNA helicase [Pseudoclavibacter chungangensis]
MSTATTQSNTTFADLGVPATLVDVLVAADRPTPFPIQEATLPSTLRGRDVLGRGKTGSGKTLAFAIPLVARLSGALAGGRRRPGRPIGLVLAPTRELATQIAHVVEPLAKAAGLTVTTVFGGVSQKPQESAFRAGVDIVVACPGRLDDLMKQGIVSLDAIEITVLDEADHMADLGFLPVVTRIMQATPSDGQRMLFSATLDNGVDKLVKRFLHDPVLHSVDEANSPVAAMTHHVFEVATPEAKTELVRTLASGTGRRILFTRTKHQAKKLAKQLTASGVPAVDLHGNLSQNARDRNLADFSEGRVRVLVATDVAARGVHVDGIELVVHVDPPAEHKAYLHRSGRTARAGSDGDVVTVMLPAQRKDTEALLRKARITVAPQRVTATNPAVTALVGEVAPHVTPRPGGPGSGNAVVASGGGTSQGQNARRKRAAREDQGGSTGGGRRGGRGGGSAQGRNASGRGTSAQGDGGRTGGARGGAGRGESAGQGGEGRAPGRSSRGRRRGRGAGETAAARSSQGAAPASRRVHSTSTPAPSARSSAAPRRATWSGER